MSINNGTIEVYHAGTDRVKTPECHFGRENLDFGRGFYVTDIYDQAVNFAKAKSRERQLAPTINIYQLDKEAILSNAHCLIFDTYSQDWLDFIVACRSGERVWEGYDYVEGGVADDRVITTVNLFMQGYIAKDEAIRRLRYLKPNNQICILNQKLLDAHLRFTDCLILPHDGLL